MNFSSDVLQALLSLDSDMDIRRCEESGIGGGGGRRRPPSYRSRSRLSLVLNAMETQNQGHNEQQSQQQQDQHQQQFQGDAAVQNGKQMKEQKHEQKEEEDKRQNEQQQHETEQKGNRERKGTAEGGNAMNRAKASMKTPLGMEMNMMMLEERIKKKIPCREMQHGMPALSGAALE
ncbi:hypothetical protein HRR78_004548 [Exophiala dermatitidis]|nr:hypothetical protein HRR75_000018 [Exophiala dermatitidis]KAJ4549739.1 hypothetical protein HRR78_004548 [Exophiala dermatitidis]